MSRSRGADRVPLSKLAVQLRYLSTIDLSLRNDSKLEGGDGFMRSDVLDDAAASSPCARRLWRVRRSIEEDPRFDAIWHLMATMPNAIFSVW